MGPFCGDIGAAGVAFAASGDDTAVLLGCDINAKLTWVKLNNPKVTIASIVLTFLFMVLPSLV